MCLASHTNHTTLFRLAMLSLVLSAVAPRLPHLTRLVSPDGADALQGFFIGTAIALIFVVSRLKGRTATSRGRNIE